MALPETPMLDDMSRPDESPLSKQDQWQLSDIGSSPMVISNLVAQKGAGGPTAFATWMGAAAVTDAEVYCEAVNVSAAVYAGLRFTEPGGTNAVDGYWCRLRDFDFSIGTIINRSTSSLVSVSFSGEPGDVMVLRAVGPSLTGYVIRGGAMMQLLSTTHTSFTSGRLAIGSEGTTGRARNFGGGPLGVQGPSERPPAIQGWRAC